MFANIVNINEERAQEDGVLSKIIILLLVAKYVISEAHYGCGCRHNSLNAVAFSMWGVHVVFLIHSTYSGGGGGGRR